MIILSTYYCGSIHQCECGAVLGYSPKDVNEGSFIYCPVCHVRQKTNMNLNYDGLVKENENGKTVV